MSKTRIVSRDELSDLSPFTKSGQPVFSSMKMMTDPQDRTKEYRVEVTPDAEDAIRVLRFLDEQNGIGWTPELKRIERELRKSLHDLMTVPHEA